MPVLANAKHELFAQELAKGRSASEAYRTVFGKDNRRYASALGQRPDISGRLRDILATRSEMERAATEKAADALAIDQAWLIARAEEARRGAMGAGQHAAAVSAIKEIGILAGLRVERRDLTHRTIHEMSDDELLAIARGGSSPTAESGAPFVH